MLFHLNFHRTVWVGRDPEAHPVPRPCPGQGPLPPAQGAPSPVQPGLEPCQGGGSHSFSGQTFPNGMRNIWFVSVLTSSQDTNIPGEAGLNNAALCVCGATGAGDSPGMCPNAPGLCPARGFSPWHLVAVRRARRVAWPGSLAGSSAPPAVLGVRREAT